MRNFTYLRTVRITNEESILDFDNAYHIHVIHFLLCLGQGCVIVVLLLLLLLGSANKLLLWLGPGVQSVLLRALGLKLFGATLMLILCELLLILLLDFGTIKIKVMSIVCSHLRRVIVI